MPRTPSKVSPPTRATPSTQITMGPVQEWPHDDRQCSVSKMGQTNPARNTTGARTAATTSMRTETIARRRACPVLSPSFGSEVIARSIDTPTNFSRSDIAGLGTLAYPSTELLCD
jgi:hypothetical protein